jgi:microcin C transport system permease protein
MKPLLEWFHPITRRRIRRFLEIRRASVSLALLAGAYVLSLGAELFCNQNPIYLRFEGRHYFPVFRFYSERALLGEGPDTRIDYKALVRSERFARDPSNRAIWPLHPYGPYEILQPERIALPDRVEIRIEPEMRVASINLTPVGRVTRGVAAGYFFNCADGEEEGLALENFWSIPDSIKDAIARRFANEPAPAISAVAGGGAGRGGRG